MSQKVNQKVATIASQAAGKHMEELVNHIISDTLFVETSVYASVFRILVKECEITPELLEQRVAVFVSKYYPGGSEKAMTHNLVKESNNSNMGQKIFSKLIKAVFPE